MKSLNRRQNNIVIFPTHQPVCRRSIEEIVFAGAFPNKVPRIFGIHSDGTATVSIRCMEGAGRGLNSAILAVLDEISVVARSGWHEPNSEDASVFRIAETYDWPPLTSVF
jgi:hypothetical protein